MRYDRSMISRHGFLLWLVAGLAVVVVFVAIEAAFIAWNGQLVPVPTIPREQTLGAGLPLSYVVMGDSTAVGQGAPYEQGIARQSAEFLAKNHRVQLTNTGISGARLADVARRQLEQANAAKPDIVLLSVGANDAVHLTSGRSAEQSLRTIVGSLRAANPHVKIIITGCPAMGSIARFPWPAKQILGLRTRQMNTVFDQAVQRDQLILAPIAARTGAAFLADKTLFARDNFHPNARGYALWTPVITEALISAMR